MVVNHPKVLWGRGGMTFFFLTSPIRLTNKLKEAEAECQLYVPLDQASLCSAETMQQYVAALLAECYRNT